MLKFLRALLILSLFLGALALGPAVRPQSPAQAAALKPVFLPLVGLGGRAYTVSGQVTDANDAPLAGVAIKDRFGRTAGWALLLPAVLASGFGIHLGRFSRFNSWDLLVRPAQTVLAAVGTLSKPAAVLFSLAFSFFVALTYLILYLILRSAARHSLGPAAISRDSVVE